MPQRALLRGSALSALALGGLVAGCGLFGGGDTPRATPLVPIESGDPTPTAGAGDPPTETAGFVESPAPSPSGEPLAPFTCDIPVSGEGTVDRAQIVDVRVGTHDGYDRIVFEFELGIPDHRLETASPPFLRDASGEPFEVLGTEHLQLTLPGGTKQSETGSSTYGGPTSFHPHYAQLQHLEEAGDFEAQSSWVMGRATDACVRVFALTSPSRLVIDLEHP